MLVNVDFMHLVKWIQMYCTTPMDALRNAQFQTNNMIY
jgi:hypothetical protein